MYSYQWHHMGVMASKITDNRIVSPTGWYQSYALFRLISKLRITGHLLKKTLVSSGFPSQRTSNGGKVFHMCHTRRVRQDVHLNLVIKVHGKPDTPCWWQMVISRRQDGWFNISVFREMEWWTSVSCEFIMDHVVMVVIIVTTITVHYV